MLKDLVVKNRSYRRFQQDAPIERHMLEELIELAHARLTRALTLDECQKYLHLEQRPPD